MSEEKKPVKLIRQRQQGYIDYIPLDNEITAEIYSVLVETSIEMSVKINRVTFLKSSYLKEAVFFNGDALTKLNKGIEEIYKLYFKEA